MSTLRKAWGNLYAGFDDVAFDVMMLTAKPRKALRVEDIPDDLLAPTLVLAAHEPKVVSSLEDLVARMEHGFPPPLHFFTFESSVFCIKYRRGEDTTMRLGPGNAELVRKALEAWR